MSLHQTFSKGNLITHSMESARARKPVFLFVSLIVHVTAGLLLSSGSWYLVDSKLSNLIPVTITLLSASSPMGEGALATGAGTKAQVKAASNPTPLSSLDLERTTFSDNQKNAEAVAEQFTFGPGPANLINMIASPPINEDLLYIRPQDLTEKPQLLQDIEPNLRVTVADFPTQTAILRLLINEMGYIDKVEVDRSRLPEEVEKIVSNVFSTLKFIPGKRNGIAVKTWLKIEVLLENTVRIPVTPDTKV